MLKVRMVTTALLVVAVSLRLTGIESQRASGGGGGGSSSTGSKCKIRCGTYNLSSIILCTLIILFIYLILYFHNYSSVNVEPIILKYKRIEKRGDQRIRFKTLQYNRFFFLNLYTTYIGRKTHRTQNVPLGVFPK